MKIAQCLEYPLGLRGGVSIVAESLVTELAQRGHKIVLVSPDTSATLQELNSGKFIEEHIYWDPLDPSATNARALARKLRTSGVDIAHFHAGGNYGWGNRFPFRSPVHYLHRVKIPVLWTSHRAETILDGFCGPQKPLPFKLLFLPLAWLGKIQQLYCCHFEIAVSKNNFEKLRRWYAPFRSRFIQIYHSRLHNAQQPGESAKRKPEIVSVGHLAVSKGQTILLEAFARIAQRHPEFTLLVAGHDGADGTLERMQKMIKEHRLEGRAIWLGQRTDTWELMSQAAIYVQPSLTEALGLALQEAMFCGCAVIGSRAGGIPELIEHEQNGLLFEPGNVEQLTCALERLINDPAYLETLGRAATKSIHERGMTADHMVRRHLELYEEAHRG